jgi:hypothetical protein
VDAADHDQSAGRVKVLWLGTAEAVIMTVVGRLRVLVLAGGVACGLLLIEGCGTDGAALGQRVQGREPSLPVTLPRTAAATDEPTALAIVSGVVWWDVDADGVRDADEPPPPYAIDVEVHMVDPSVPDGYVKVLGKTDEQGVYHIADAPVGEVTVSASLDGWTTPPSRVITTAVEEAVTVDFGAHFGTTAGFAWFDSDADGVVDEGELPVEGLEVTLGYVSTFTAADGTYSLAGGTGQDSYSLSYIWRGDQAVSPVPLVGNLGAVSVDPPIWVFPLDWTGKPDDSTPGVHEVGVHAWFGDRPCRPEGSIDLDFEQCLIPDTAEINVALVRPTFDYAVETDAPVLTTLLGSQLLVSADISVSGGPFISEVLSAELTVPPAFDVRALPLGPGRWRFAETGGSLPTKSPPTPEPPIYYLRPMCPPDEYGSTMRTCGPLEGSLDPIEVFLDVKDPGTYQIEIELPTSIGTGLVDSNPANNSVVITIEVLAELPRSS